MLSPVFRSLPQRKQCSSTTSSPPTRASSKQVLFVYIICLPVLNVEKVDWGEVARKGGYANGSTASVRYGQIKKRLGLNEASTPAKSSTPTKARVKKEVGSGTNTTPSKVAKKTTSKTKVSKVADARFFDSLADEDDENFNIAKEEDMGYGDDFAPSHFDHQNDFQGASYEQYDVSEL